MCFFPFLRYCQDVVIDDVMLDEEERHHCYVKELRSAPEPPQNVIALDFETTLDENSKHVAVGASMVCCIFG